MDLKAFGLELAKLGLPLLGAALPFPGGAALGAGLAGMIGAKSADPADVLATLTGNAQALAQAKQFELTHQERMLDIATRGQMAARAADSADLAAVNVTLQTEAMGGSWLQRNHHAVESLWVVGMVSAIYVLLPVMNVTVPTVPGEVWIMLGAILGVTAWQRGATNTAVAKATGA